MVFEFMSLTSKYLTLALPCPQQPPEATNGSWRWYGLDYTRYRCQNGYTFAGGNYPDWYSNCSVFGNWDPPVMDKCIRKLFYVSSAVVVVISISQDLFPKYKLNGFRQAYTWKSCFGKARSLPK